ncbi:hypothetical protein H0262_05455 [Psychrobacter cryohalolentis]|uniref:phage tail terminator protein n=1 Tax=Psychrobacter sp. D2 TaxID=2759702 RepID=UPI0015E61ECB|nr:hypothetical protein [Psychrobacter sp. D2]MBA2057327.1 hypothetical protein [Psychrobacter sp. D2]
MSTLEYFAVEPVLVDNIKNNVTGLIDVDTPFSIESMLDNRNNAPSVSIIWYGERFSEQVGRDNRVKSIQYDQWLVVLKVNDTESQSTDTQSIRALADPFLVQLHDCMMGFNPELKGYTRFTKTACPVTNGSDSSFAYFPFMFEILRTI